MPAASGEGSTGEVIGDAKRLLVVTGMLVAVGVDRAKFLSVGWS
jgi:hypothetical protein